MSKGFDGTSPKVWDTGNISLEEATRRHHERERLRKEAGIYTHQELTQIAVEEVKRMERNAKCEGDDFVGPPDPRKLWKSRPPMKD